LIGRKHLDISYSFAFLTAHKAKMQTYKTANCRLLTHSNPNRYSGGVLHEPTSVRFLHHSFHARLGFEGPRQSCCYLGCFSRFCCCWCSVSTLIAVENGDEVVYGALFYASTLARLGGRCLRQHELAPKSEPKLSWSIFKCFQKKKSRERENKMWVLVLNLNISL